MARSVARKIEVVGCVVELVVVNRMRWYSFTGTWWWRHVGSLEPCSRQGSCLYSNQIPISWWSLRILPPSSLPQFISSHMPLILYSNESDSFFTFQLPPSQFKSLLLNIGVACYFITFLTGHLYKKIPPIFPSTKLIFQQQFWSVD